MRDDDHWGRLLRGDGRIDLRSYRMASLAFLSSGLAVLAFLLVPASSRADSNFRINRDMAGIALGMTASEVREHHGAPTRIDAGPDFTAWSYRRPSMEVTLKPEVVTLHTASRSIRGPRAIGVGTSLRRLKAVLGSRLRCRSAGGRGYCVVGSFATGRRSTVFDLRRRRVVAVTISVSTP